MLRAKWRKSSQKMECGILQVQLLYNWLSNHEGRKGVRTDLKLEGSIEVYVFNGGVNAKSGINLS